ncbi:hypothetical protein BH11GEM1_BH11GEM1_25790 [soil metagenome]
MICTTVSLGARPGCVDHGLKDQSVDPLSDEARAKPAAGSDCPTD